MGNALQIDIKFIQNLALKNGANHWAVKKWKTRKSIPLEWQVKLMEMEPGVLTFSDFKRIHASLLSQTKGK